MHHNSGPLASLFEKKNFNLKLFINIVNNLEFRITETDFCLQFRVAVKAFLMKSNF